MKRKLSIEGMKCSHCVGNLKDTYRRYKWSRRFRS